MYQAAIQYVGWAYRLCERLKGFHRNVKDQRLRAFQAIPLNIAEGNGKATEADRGYAVYENAAGYEAKEFDSDTDSDTQKR